jgi:hypothetical protein
MPIEIRQLTIKANVRDSSREAGTDPEEVKDLKKKAFDVLGFNEKEELVNEVVFRVMEQIKAQTKV